MNTNRAKNVSPSTYIRIEYSSTNNLMTIWSTQAGSLIGIQNPLCTLAFREKTFHHYLSQVLSLNHITWKKKHGAPRNFFSWTVVDTGLNIWYHPNHIYEGNGQKCRKRISSRGCSLTTPDEVSNEIYAVHFE